jgi:K+-sensing histidine kinase KdpD
MMRRRPLNWPSRLTETILPVGAALLINLITYEVMATRALFFLFLLAIALTTTLAGWWYGFLATLVSTAAVLFFFVEPRFTLETAHAEEWNRLAVFALAGVIAIAAAIWARRRRNGHHLIAL